MKKLTEKEKKERNVKDIKIDFAIHKKLKLQATKKDKSIKEEIEGILTDNLDS